jgi:hypothetical protein
MVANQVLIASQGIVRPLDLHGDEARDLFPGVPTNAPCSGDSARPQAVL